MTKRTECLLCRKPWFSRGECCDACQEESAQLLAGTNGSKAATRFISWLKRKARQAERLAENIEKEARRAEKEDRDLKAATELKQKQRQ